MLAGLKLAGVPEGRTESETVPVKPFSAFTETVVLALEPDWTVSEEGESESEKSGVASPAGVPAPGSATATNRSKRREAETLRVRPRNADVRAREERLG